MKSKIPKPPRPPKTRLPSPEEAALWQQLSAGIAPLKVERPAPEFKAARPSLQNRLEPEAPPPPLPRRPQGTFAPVIFQEELDRPLLRHFRRGTRAPAARLDLHGVRQEAAQERLLRFVAESAIKGHQWVVIITGKGSPDKPSVLKTEVPKWLHMLPEYVVSFAPALPEEGGDGALYVHIRKPR